MSRGRRYNHEPKLNIKKVIATIRDAEPIGPKKLLDVLVVPFELPLVLEFEEDILVYALSAVKEKFGEKIDEK